MRCYASRMGTNAYLRSRWKKTLQRAEISVANSDLIEEILSAYGESGRHYHTCEHLRHMFEVYDRFFLNPSLVHELTFWYHDFYYDPQRVDNEDRSGWKAKKVVDTYLQVPGEVGSKVRDLISFSHYTRDPMTRDEKVLHDVDLAIFGESVDLFNAYEVSIRQEYHFVPEKEYRSGRSRILSLFLRNPFYFTPELFYSSYEELAQRNIQRSIQTLAGQ